MKHDFESALSYMRHIENLGDNASTVDHGIFAVNKWYLIKKALRIAAKVQELGLDELKGSAQNVSFGNLDKQQSELLKRLIEKANKWNELQKVMTDEQ
jgi:hypothetical protein